MHFGIAHSPETTKCLSDATDPDYCVAIWQSGRKDKLKYLWSSVFCSREMKEWKFETFPFVALLTGWASNYSANFEHVYVQPITFGNSLTSLLVESRNLAGGN
jgi:hypothetical protein